MRVHSDPLRSFIAHKIQIATDGALSSDQAYDQLVEPPSPDLGDFAFGCFMLAKTLRKAPPQISQELKAKITLSNDLVAVDAAGPYLNFTLSADFLGKNLIEPIKNGSYFQRKLTERTPRTMIEFSQPNTHKEIHVGHMRNACLGDTIVRLHRYVGFEVVSSTFPGDVGTHVAKCLWYLKYHNQEPIPQDHRGEWLGRIYSKAHLKLEDEVGTSKEEDNRAQLTAILKQLEAKQGEYFQLWQETRQWSVNLMNRVYDWAGISFDKWYWESDVDSDSVKYVQDLYQQGKLIKSNGAIGMDLDFENEKLGFCMLLKSDGTGLYATKDLELARRKFLENNIQKSIYVVDMRQSLHFKQVFKVLTNLGFPQAQNCFHLAYNFVELPDGPMSSRKGNIVALTELILRMEEMVKNNYLQRYSDEWSQDEINLVASQVAQGAIKYGMLRMDTNKKIVFDMNEWLKIDGESGPFIQYSAARINSLCLKFDYSGDAVQWNLLTHSAERKLVRSLMNFNSYILTATELYRPSMICTYLYETAKRFNLFYHECSIGHAETLELQQARLALAHCTGEILKKGLSLLGIPAPQRM